MTFVLTWHILKVLVFGEVDSSLLFGSFGSVSIFFINEVRLHRLPIMNSVWCCESLKLQRAGSASVIAKIKGKNTKSRK